MGAHRAPPCRFLRETAFGLRMSLNTLVETADGFDDTGADCTEGMKEQDSVKLESTTWSDHTRWSSA